MYQTSIRSDQISEADLKAVADNLAKLTGKEIHIDKMYIVSTDDMNISSMLDSLSESLPVNAAPAVKSKANQVKKSKKVSKADAPLGPRSMCIVATGEVLSTRELKQRLASGTIEEMTTIENGKGERYVVIDGKLAREPKAES